MLSIDLQNCHMTFRDFVILPYFNGMLDILGLCIIILPNNLVLNILFSLLSTNNVLLIDQKFDFCYYNITWNFVLLSG